MLYADDLILMSTSPEGLQRQLDALASFCDQRQLAVNLSKTKVVILRPGSLNVIRSSSTAQWWSAMMSTDTWDLSSTPRETCHMVLTT